MTTFEKISDDFHQLNSRIQDSNTSEFDPVFFNKTIAIIHRLILKLFEQLQNGKSIVALRQEIHEIRNIHSNSKFINRLQNWPEGYQGDYITIEYICRGKQTNTGFRELSDYIELYSLNSAISQQHRNKILKQAILIGETLKKSNSNILICACGSSYDLRLLENTFDLSTSSTIVLNDLDQNALDFSFKKLSSKTKKQVILEHSNALTLIRNLNRKNKQFDLILFGGLFDYLSDKQIKFLLMNSYNLLKPNGKIVFTNIALKNPYKPWIEICANWELIERTSKCNYSICREAGIPEANIFQYKEDTGLTNIVEIIKK